MTLPTLDLSLFTNGSDTVRRKLASDLLDSLSHHGFVKLVNHGISEKTVSRLFEWVRCYSTLLVTGVALLTAILLRSAEQVILSYATSR